MPNEITPTQWTSLLLMSDAFLPALPTEDVERLVQAQGDITEERRVAIRKFLTSTPSESQAYKDTLEDALKNRLTPKGCGDVKQFVDILNSSVPAYLLTGSSTPFASLSAEQAQATVTQLYQSRISTIRFGIKTVGSLLRAIYLRSDPIVAQAVGYPGVPAVPEETQEDSPAKRFKAKRDAFFSAATKDSGADMLRWETEVLVVGTGSGATSLVGSLATKLEDAIRSGAYAPLPGRKADIVMLEKGDYFAPHELEKTENDSFAKMYEGGGILGSETGNISIFAGATVGGGSKINWSASLAGSNLLRQEWTKRTAVHAKDAKKLSNVNREVFRTMFQGKEWQDCMDEVCKILHVKTPKDEDHNAGNQTLLEGARRLGYVCKSVPQNITGSFADHRECGANCTVGCRGRSQADDAKTGRSGKMSGERAFLDEFLHLDPEQAKGGKSNKVTVEILDKFEVQRVVFEEIPGVSGKKAIGVLGTVKGNDGTVHNAFIKANKVVVSAGALNSPCILLRSGLKNPQIGKNLYLHPTCIVLSEWDEEVRPWEGGILTTVIDEFSNLDGHGHGVKLEGMDMMPGLSMGFTPWSSGAQFKKRVLRYTHTQGHIVLCREKEPGRVRIDPTTGKLLIDYIPSAIDRKHILEGIIAMCKVLYTMGAKEISTPTVGAPVWHRDEASTTEGASGEAQAADGWAADARFVAFLAALESRGLPLDISTFGSAHQMGTCRMGSSPAHSVVDQRGEVWGCQGLYVADSSVFPSASGVNPMLTTMTFGRWIGRRMAEEMQASAKEAAEPNTQARL